MSKGQFLSRAFTGFCGAIAFFATLYTIWIIGPSIETRYFPVVSKLQILSLEAAPDGDSKINVAYTKLRNCEYMGLAWYYGDRPRDFQRVPIILNRNASDEESPNRPLGYQRTGPWIVGIPPEQIKTKSFAILQHRCHVFWNTTTEFYP